MADNNAKVKILGIAGSLRKASYNRAALQAAKGLTPDNAATIEIYESLGDIPPFNQDIENPLPGVVGLEAKNTLL